MSRPGSMIAAAAGLLLATGIAGAWYWSAARHAPHDAGPRPGGTVPHPFPEWVNDVPAEVREKMRQRGMYGAWALLQPRPGGIDPQTKRRLDALGYVDGVAVAPERANVVAYDPRRAWNGLNLYVAGHGEEALLIDMEGRLQHRWFFDLRTLADRLTLPDVPIPFRRVHPFPNGDVLVLYDYNALVKLDRDSHLLWAYTQGPHHDMWVTEEGDIYALTATVRAIPALQLPRVVDNSIVRLDASGQELDRVSILDALQAGGWNALLDEVRRLVPEALGDVLHTNSVEVLDGRVADRLPALAMNNVLISCLKIHAVLVLDFAARKVIWVLRGPFRFQHHARLLDDGNLLLFDNHRGPERRSAVLEIEPASGRVVWSYGGTEAEPMFSTCCGTTYRLPNGDTLIVETQAGRAFEVTPAHEIVWDFVNPHRAGSDQRLIAQLFDLVRLPPDFGRGWLDPAAR